MYSQLGQGGDKGLSSTILIAMPAVLILARLAVVRHPTIQYSRSRIMTSRKGMTQAPRAIQNSISTPPKIRAKKVFNNEAEFGMIPNKYPKETNSGSEKDKKTDFCKRESAFRKIGKRFIYKAFPIYIQIVFYLYIKRFQ
ncbi:hypothetical protein HR15_00770 [Porphyromonas gulae]|uniref:Uncharacterized protein n=1 Tax=Porphyromonas gulae TaxID=111105 RepID=A0A0A2FWM1_9PORP|nr:hypothetical protein HR15_00770 [Porphyromonas gulae]